MPSSGVPAPSLPRIIGKGIGSGWAVIPRRLNRSWGLRLACEIFTRTQPSGSFRFGAFTYRERREGVIRIGLVAYTANIGLPHTPSRQSRAQDQVSHHLHEVRRPIERMSAVDLRAFVVQRLDSLIRLGRGFAHLADSLADKQEIFGIDMASLNETAGLLGTSAWIRRIHQAALVVHEVAQVPPSTGQALAKVLRGELQYFGGDGVADAQDGAENVSQALLTIEAEQHSGGTGKHRFSYEQIPVRRRAFGVGRIEVRYLFEFFTVSAKVY